MISAKNIHKKYAELEILKGITVDINKGEVVSVVGSSGAGKTTLLTILGTLDRPTSGELFIDGTDVYKLNDKKLAAFRNLNIGFVFQFHHLLPEFDALENVCMPALIAKTSKKQAETKAKELLDYLGLKDRFTHKPSELSGGEQQRVAVARALINSPKIIFADEPSGNLDSNTAQELHQLFFNLRKELNQTFVIVTHNTELADMADRKLVMKDGKVI
ncbi:MAG: ABC transporter ATP-binding protein [Bacteroidia bacterium]|jgi:lipoprotein-releasing system ATP-binding protein|nr:ABC transporter ATP-binding protein [Bacteroidia bacterium]